MKQPLVTVLMECYNCESFVAEAIQSVLEQTYQNFEFLITNDCSTDNSDKTIKAFTDNRIKYTINKENLGVVKSRNNALKQAQGKYIASIDADDAWYPNKLETQINFLENNPQYAACFTWVDIIDENSQIYTNKQAANHWKNLFNKHNKDNWPKFFFENLNCLNHSSSVIKRDVIENVGCYDERYYLAADFDVWLRISSNYKIILLEQKLAKYRRVLENNTSMSNITREKDIRHYNDLNNAMYNFIVNMADEKFIDFFKDYLVVKKPNSTQIKCEKFFVLKTLKLYGNKSIVPAQIYINQLMNDEITRKCLNDTYNFDMHSYGDFMSQPSKTCPYYLYDEYLESQKFWNLAKGFAKLILRKNKKQ